MKFTYQSPLKVLLFYAIIFISNISVDQTAQLHHRVNITIIMENITPKAITSTELDLLGQKCSKGNVSCSLDISEIESTWTVKESFDALWKIAKMQAVNSVSLSFLKPWQGRYFHELSRNAGRKHFVFEANDCRLVSVLVLFSRGQE